MSNKIVSIDGLQRFFDNLRMYFEDIFNKKQDTLVSGDSIKTINNNSILGSGNVNVGTITEIKMNGASKGTNGVVDLGTVITSHQDISGKLDKTEANSTYLTKSDAQNTYLEKSGKAVSSASADNATKALQDYNGNNIVDTYATKAALDGKVNKENGKGLSTEDFTTALKNKLTELTNYDDTALNNSISNLQTQINTLVSGNSSDAINSFNEIIAFLDGIKDTQDLESIIASIEQQIATVNNSIPTKVSQLTNDSNYITKTTGDSTYLGIDAKATSATGADWATIAYRDTDNNLIKDTYATKAELRNKVTVIDGKGLSTEDYTTTEKNKLNTIQQGAEVNVQSDWNVTDSTSDAFIKNKPTFATVAISGSYNDLTNKPTIPSAVTESTVSGWGFTKNTGTYSKPSGGIPKSDLSSAIQTSLGKADTALQSYTEQYKGTVGVSSTSVELDDVDTVNYVKYVAQSLTDAQKEQVRTNIGAAAIGETGNVDLTDYATKTFVNNAITSKQDVISDLATIRTNAALGATALQTETYKGTVTGVKINGTTKNPSSGVVDLGTVITSHQDISGKADKSSLATVATSGSYNDLSNKPTIPSAVTESTVSGWGFTKNTGTYSKPSGGIPKSDLASAVQTSLGKADTALQEIPNEYPTTTGVVTLIGQNILDGIGSINGKKIWVDPSSGDYSPSFNFKTINGTSILGSGDITISSEGDYLPSSGGMITGDLIVNGTIASPTMIVASGGVRGYLRDGDYVLGINNIDGIVWGEDGPDQYCITASGDGTKFLSDDGTYKKIESGNSDANVQAVDTGDILDDVNVDYATSSYVNNLFGDINSVLESIIGGNGLTSGKKIVPVEVSNGSISFNESKNLPFEPNKIYYATTIVDESISIDWVIPPTEGVGKYCLHFSTALSGLGVELELPSDWLWEYGKIDESVIEFEANYELSVVATKVNDSYVYKASLTRFE